MLGLKRTGVLFSDIGQHLHSLGTEWCIVGMYTVWESFFKVVKLVFSHKSGGIKKYIAQLTAGERKAVCTCVPKIYTVTCNCDCASNIITKRYLFSIRSIFLGYKYPHSFCTPMWSNCCDPMDCALLILFQVKR